MTRPSSPLNSWLKARAAGVLLHPTSLGGDFGVGTLGSEARIFVDFLHETKIAYWQLCPLGPTGYGDSPYQCFSAFAGNPYLIDALDLSERDLVSEDSLGPLLFLPSDRVDYATLYRIKWPILFHAARNFRKQSKDKKPYGNYEEFKEKHAYWLDDYALFHALKEHHDGRAWHEWPAKHRNITQARKSVSDSGILDRAEDHRVLQYFFFGQWKQLRRYAHARNVRFIGDVPIFVSGDSADVWAHPDKFLLDPDTGMPTEVAGVPPDYFSDTGQLWGNPLFNWKALEADGYDWWMERMQVNFDLYDIVRLDHFRGFESYWSVPADAADARGGAWVKGPGLPFFKALKDRFPRGCMIAEDLGILTDDVLDLRKATGLPGMAILQFAFGDTAENPYLPHNHEKNSVVYPGTHDNNTTLGWYDELDESTKDHTRRYFRISGEDINWDFVRACYRSPARLAVLPLQDLMSLGTSARLNRPGTAEGNWQWRFLPDQLETLRKESGHDLRELARLYGREPRDHPEATK